MVKLTKLFSSPVKNLEISAPRPVETPAPGVAHAAPRSVQPNSQVFSNAQVTVPRSERNGATSGEGSAQRKPKSRDVLISAPHSESSAPTPTTGREAQTSMAGLRLNTEFDHDLQEAADRLSKAKRTGDMIKNKTFEHPAAPNLDAAMKHAPKVLQHLTDLRANCPPGQTPPSDALYKDVEILATATQILTHCMAEQNVTKVGDLKFTTTDAMQSLTRAHNQVVPPGKAQAQVTDGLYRLTLGMAQITAQGKGNVDWPLFAQMGGGKSLPGQGDYMATFYLQHTPGLNKDIETPVQASVWEKALNFMPPGTHLD